MISVLVYATISESISGAVALSDKNGALVEPFIARWQNREGGAERANYAMFLAELCDMLDVPRPHPAAATSADNDYVFERAVKKTGPDGSTTQGRIDLYKRDCFVLEAKQTRQQGGKKEVDLQPDLLGTLAPRAKSARIAATGFDVLMLNAHRQATDYARSLPIDHGWPPFILVCDVGNVIETYADFSGQGKNYAQFPDRRGFRITLDQLRDPAIRDRLRRIWIDPQSLDPARKSARVTRDIAERLAAVSRALEAGHKRETVALFLMRCLFTMFAEDCGLLPPDAFKTILRRCEADPDMLAPTVGQLWEAMDKGGVALAIHARVPRFNGEFFRDQTVLPLGREAIGELRRAAEYDWREVDPSIFGTLLEQALDPAERRSLGAHYTPRAYVERLVVATMIEPLRAEWVEVLATAERQRAEGRDEIAIATVTNFAEKLCRTRVLDPACGTGNFLYVALELLKRLEGEVLDALASLGGQEALALASHTVDPHQFLGLEANPRAAGIAELVLWIGHLQWHFRTHDGMPGEPILQAFRNIKVADAVLDPKTHRRPAWPAAEYIIGNPPFIGGKDIRARLGNAYIEALWAAHPQMNNSADFVMYWWDHAAELLTAKGTVLRRFGFVTTNSITQTFQRRCIERHLAAKSPISIVMAVADHPWTKATKDAAAVRIAMTVAEAGKRDGVLFTVSAESGLDTDAPEIALDARTGPINADLTVGVAVGDARPLLANEGLCSRGMMLFGAGFIVSPEQAAHLGLGRRPNLENHIRHYRNGRDLTSRSRGVMAIDMFGLSVDEVRQHFPEVYQHLLTTVKPEREKNRDNDIKSRWWLFGRTRDEIRPALLSLPRYIATVETAKHRIFQFLDAAILPDNMLVAIGSADGFYLGVLQSRIHGTWALRAGGWLGVGNDPRYTKSRCFDPFPFPDPPAAIRQEIAAIAEELDAHRKRVLAEHPHLTLTGLYNVRDLIRAGTKPAEMSEADRRTLDDGLVLILDELHRNLDRAVSEAYGWPHDLPEAETLARLVALNRDRRAEEARGLVRWLRPDYQIPRFGRPEEKLDLAGGDLRPERIEAARNAFPADEVAQTAVIMAALATAPAGIAAADLALRFKGRALRPKVDSVLAGLVRLGVVGTAGRGVYRLNLAA
ncbi:MAG: class I SAM-dependent DNA methyltransferase [Acidiphilium sp.]|nr:class I SAM-dependent DNA methyltransferase [Acidiphilium sp.]